MTLTDGAVGAEEPISTEAVLQDAPVVANEGAVALLALQGTMVHAVWSEDSGGDLKRSARPHGGSWSAEQTLWSSPNQGALSVCCSVLGGGCDCLACTCDIGPHADDTGKIEYTEVVLP